MSRSLKKGPYVDQRILEKIEKLKPSQEPVIKTWARNSAVSPEMVGVRLAIHNGRQHIPVLIVEDMVGHKLGEFVPTRKFLRHGGRMAREEEQAVSKSGAQGSKTMAKEPEGKKELNKKE